MMMQNQSAIVASVYMQVVDDVVANMRDEFLAEVDERILIRLQQLWELKLFQAGAISRSVLEARGQLYSKLAFRQPVTPNQTTPQQFHTQIPPVQDLNIPYEGEDVPHEETLFPRTPGSNANTEHEYIPPAPAEQHSNMARPSVYMRQPSQWMTPMPDIHISYDENQTGGGKNLNAKDFVLSTAGKRKRDEVANQIPQQDGAGDCQLLGSMPSSSQKAGSGQSSKFANSAKIPQYDGVDDYEVAEDYNVAVEEAEAECPVRVVMAEQAIPDNLEPPLNEDDDEEDDLGEDDEEPKTDNLVLCQFEKVTRSKNKWKCILKDGIMHLNNRDTLFSKANGEFDF